MAANKAQISAWFDEGIVDKCAYMIVVCDTFDHEDYPVYASTADECLKRYAEFNGHNMQRIMEVYDLRLNKARQMAEKMAWHLPECKAKKAEGR